MEVLHFGDLACRELERAGITLSGEEVTSGEVVQGTCPLQVSCNEQPVCLLAFPQSEKESARPLNQKAT